MMKNVLPLSLPLLLLILLQCTTTLAQAQSPAPAGPTNITKILEKAGGFTTFIRLLQLTQTSDRINTQLRKSSGGLTIFAPSDAAFSALKTGTLNSLTDQQKVSLVLFHILPTFLTLPQFQTVSNPVRTQAGDTGPFLFPLNVTTSGSQVNITTGINKASVAGTVYSDNQLAVYQVDNVLLPLNIFGPQPPAPAPGPKPKKPAADGSPVAARSGIPVSSAVTLGGAVHSVVAALGGVAYFTAFYL
ncbi:FASCICLIN-like arabinogalactan-protein 11 [Perilla frutescens var. frutescens]|nr:FASCICLIN-like arabinogalactan-protein 11 [Perilla frutescens var. frutescens]